MVDRSVHLNPGVNFHTDHERERVMEMVDGTKLGNLARVYHDLSANREREDFIRRADERRGPLDAEIVDGRSPSWHALATVPTHERIAAGHLIGRRFGVYLPESEREVISRGRRRVLRRLLLPGYLLIFVWDVVRHLRRIEACPGVLRVITSGERPVVIEDALIDRIRAAENSERLPLVYTIEEVVTKKRWRQSRKVTRQVQLDPDDIVGIRSYSADMGADPAEEPVEQVVSAFHKAIGLPCAGGLTESPI